MAVATFGAGCFWQVEATYRALSGVLDTAVGFMGGSKGNPTYREVCTGRTGHAEVLQVEYDPERVSYDQLLDLFWENHDPTTLNRQGPDIGTQYRSVIFGSDEAQLVAAQASRERWQPRFGSLIVTEIVPAERFWRAEEYHQRYLEKHGLVSCTLGTPVH